MTSKTANLTTARLVALIALLSVAGCASQYSGVSASDPYGFFSGLLHGIVSPIAIALKFFDWLTNLIGINLLGEIYVIGKPNTGLTYWIGTLIGFWAWFGLQS